jgi:hypothetical protein
MDPLKELGDEQNILCHWWETLIAGQENKNREKIPIGFFSVYDLQPFLMSLSFLTMQATLASDPRPIFWCTTTIQNIFLNGDNLRCVEYSRIATYRILRVEQALLLKYIMKKLSMVFFCRKAEQLLFRANNLKNS